jgi:hypothetical protein
VIKKGALEEIEQEIMQLKSLPFAHTQSCKDNKIIAWVEGGANKPTIPIDVVSGRQGNHHCSITVAQ